MPISPAILRLGIHETDLSIKLDHWQDPEKLHVKLRLDAYDLGTEALLHDPEVLPIKRLAQFVIDLVQDWDLGDTVPVIGDDGEPATDKKGNPVTKFEPVPLTMAGLQHIPVAFLSAVLTEGYGAIRPKS